MYPLFYLLTVLSVLTTCGKLADALPWANGSLPAKKFHAAHPPHAMDACDNDPYFKVTPENLKESGALEWFAGWGEYPPSSCPPSSMFLLSCEKGLDADTWGNLQTQQSTETRQHGIAASHIMTISSSSSFPLRSMSAATSIIARNCHARTSKRRRPITGPWPDGFISSW